MRIVNTSESQLAELLELGRTMLGCGGIHRRKDDEEVRGKRIVDGKIDGDDDDGEERVVCVTSGVSYLGLAIVNQLLNRGYSVRVVVHTEEDLGKLREMETRSERMTTGNNDNTKKKIGAVVAKLTELEGLLEAFDGCCAVFHTSAFVDPAGLSGFSKSMAEIEVKASENVMEACARTPSVTKCVLTSSLLACIWQDASSQGELSSVINHDSWSDETVCIEKKLWYALGKLRAEKAAWRIAKEKGLKLTTICPGLVTGPELCCRNSTATIAYLKGAQEMYAGRLLASVDVTRLAEAHVCVLDAMNKTASGRYIYFDRIIDGEDEARKLAEKTDIPTSLISGTPSRGDYWPQFQISNRRISSLMSRTMFPCYNESLQSN